MNTQTDIYGFVMARLAEKRIPQRQVAAASGVPFSTLAKIAQGSIKGPSVHHVQALYDYFLKVGAVGTAVDAQDGHNANVRAATAPHKIIDMSQAAQEVT